MPRARLAASILAVNVAACSSSASTSATAPDAATDGGSDGSTTVDASDAGGDVAVHDAANEASGEGGEGGDPCGTPGPAWSRCAANPVDQAGFQQPDGRYEVSIGDPDVQYDGAAHLWRMWWSTTLMVHYGDPTSTLGIKYGTSSDGVTWKVQPALTIASSGNAADWDSAKVETPTVLHMPNNPPGTRYLLWYSGAGTTMLTVNGSPVTGYQIGAATSDDGTSFTRVPASMSPYGKAGLVLEGKDAFPGLAGVADGLVADPEIVFDGALLHLFFSSLAVDASGKPLAFGVSHATSTDGIHWTPAAGNPIAATNGSKGPSVVKTAQGSWEMYYQQDSSSDLAMVPSTFNPQLGIWKTTSSDLTTWTAPGAARELEWDGSLVTEKYGWIAVGDMALVGGEHRYYYPAFSGLTPPSPTWVCPTQTGNVPSLIVLDVARKN